MPGRNSVKVGFRVQRGDYAMLRAFAAQRGQPVSVVLRDALAQSPLLLGLQLRIGEQPTPVAPLFAAAPINPSPVVPLVQPYRLSRQPGGLKAASALRRGLRDRREGLLSDTR